MHRYDEHPDYYGIVGVYKISKNVPDAVDHRLHRLACFRQDTGAVRETGSSGVIAGSFSGCRSTLLQRAAACQRACSVNQSGR